MTNSLFLYGPLLDPDVFQSVAGQPLDGQPVVLASYKIVRVSGQTFPAVLKDPDATVDGFLVKGLTEDVLKALDFYRDTTIFTRTTVHVELDGIPATVQIHLPIDTNTLTDHPWNLQDLSTQDIAYHREAARQIMRIYADRGPYNQPLNHHGLNMRARSSVRAAATSDPIGIRHGLSQEDVKTSKRSQPYARYFAVEEYTLTHRKFAGGETEPLERSVFLSADAVIVLPYDPVLDLVLLVEQFRPGPFARGDRFPWMLEPVAGRCDGDENLEGVASRELMEEAGLEAQHLEKIASFYPSPGCLSEYKHIYVAVVSLEGRIAGTYGLATEGEDILTHILPWKQAEALLTTGEANNSSSVVTLMWLQANRDRLRNAWSGA